MGVLQFKEFFQLLTEARRYSGEYVLDVLEQYKDDPDVYISFTHNLGGPKLGINPQSKYGTPLGIYAYPVKAMWHEIQNNRIPFAGDREYIWVFKPNRPNKLVYASKFKMEDIYKAFKDKVIDLKRIDYINESGEKLKNLFFKIVKKLTPDLKKIVAKITKSRVELFDLTDSWANWPLFMKYQLLYLQPKHNTDLRVEFDFYISDEDRRKISFMFQYENAELKYLDKDGNFNDEEYINGDELTHKISPNHQKNPAQIFMSIARLMAKENPIKWAKVMKDAGYDGIVDDIGSQIIHHNEPKQAVFFRLRDIKVIKLIHHKNGKNWNRPTGSKDPFYETFLKGYKYVVNEDKSVDILESIIVDSSWGKIPFPIREVHGDFTINNIDVKGFKNFPKKIKQGTLILKGLLTLNSLEGLSTKTNQIRIHACGIKNLSGLPEKLDYLSITHCHDLISLEGAPKKINGDFTCQYNSSLTSLESGPKYVGGDFLLNRNNLNSLEGSPEYVGGIFDCSHNNLKNFMGGPKEVANVENRPISIMANMNELEIGNPGTIPIKGLPHPFKPYYVSTDAGDLLVSRIYKFQVKNVSPKALEFLIDSAKSKGGYVHDPKYGDCFWGVHSPRPGVPNTMFVYYMHDGTTGASISSKQYTIVEEYKDEPISYEQKNPSQKISTSDNNIKLESFNEPLMHLLFKYISMSKYFSSKNNLLYKNKGATPSGIDAIISSYLITINEWIENPKTLTQHQVDRLYELYKKLEYEDSHI